MAQSAAPVNACIGKEVAQVRPGAPHNGYSSEDDIVAHMTFIGGSGGHQYPVKAWKAGKLITKLRVYSGYSTIKAIRLWLSGDEMGDYQEFGEPEDTDYKEFEFDDGERLESLSLWGNGAGTRAGWIRFKTNKGKSFDYGMYGWGKKQEYEVNVGSGILVGALYNAGGDIDAHGYYFLKSSIARTVVSDVSYPTLHFDTQSVAPVTIKTFEDSNSSSNSITWTFQGEHEVTSSQSWTTTLETAFSMNASVEAGVPEVVKEGISYGWQVSDTASHETSEEEKDTLSWSNSGELQPNQHISLVAVTRKGTLDVPYSSTVTVTLNNGATFSFPQQGVYLGVSFSDVEIEDKDFDKYEVL